MQKFQLLLSAMLVATPGFVQGQGCSDAGFCTAGAMQSHGGAQDTLAGHALGLSFTAGAGEQGVLALSPQVEWRHSLGKSYSIEVKLPYFIANGDLGTYSGLGDPIATVTRSWKGEKAWDFFTTAGLRVSLTNAAKTNAEGRPLPMPYQPGLGTTDLIVGAAARYNGWLFFSAGYQQPVFQYNENGYLASAYPGESEAYKSYFDSRNLSRKGDVFLRAEGQFTRKRMTFSGGPLLIYHLGEDLLTDANGNESSIAGSAGATLNLAAKVSWQLTQSRWELAAGTPLLVRTTRPDGLTRSLTLTLRYERYFGKRK